MKHIALCLGLLAGAALAGPAALAQAPGSGTEPEEEDKKKPPEGRKAFFLERSFFFVWIPERTVLAAPPYYGEAERARDDDEIQFEALPSPHLFFKNNLTFEDLKCGTRGTDDCPRPAGKLPKFLGDRLVASFVFMTRLRQLGGFSSPLRNPSFMPRLTLQRLSVTNSTAGDIIGPISIFGPQLVLWGHHSNGGSGCLFLEDQGPDCTSPIPPEQRTVNTRSGSFSTNYVKLAYHYQRAYPRASDGNWIRRSWTLSGWVELNPKNWGPGALDAGQRAIYGPRRYGASFEYQHQVGQKKPWNLSINPSYEYIDFDKRPAADSSPHRFIVDLTAVKEDGLLSGWGLAARFYQGQDFNNLLFVRDIRRVQVGLVVDQNSRRLKAGAN